MTKLKLPVCFRVYNHDQLHKDVRDLEKLGYVLDKEHTEVIVKARPNFWGLHLHLEADKTMCVYLGSYDTECVRNLDYIINELELMK